jgi:polysaccharide biosynthesis/export protein
MTPLQAISAAGGLSPFAKAKRIYILRTQQGKQVKIPFDYKKAIRNGDQQGLSLSPGDTIVIP